MIALDGNDAAIRSHAWGLDLSGSEQRSMEVA
jgi:hypothetical protein